MLSYFPLSLLLPPPLFKIRAFWCFYNLKLGFLQNNDQRGTSLSDNFIHLSNSSFRVRHWTMMTFVYAFRRMSTHFHDTSYRVRHRTLMTFIYAFRRVSTHFHVIETTGSRTLQRQTPSQINKRTYRKDLFPIQSALTIVTPWCIMLT